MQLLFILIKMVFPSVNINVLKTEFEFLAYECGLKVFILRINVAEIVYSNVRAFFFEFFVSPYPIFKVLNLICCSFYGQRK